MTDLLKLRQTANGSERPAARTRILSARFTENEHAELENYACSKRKTLGDWAHEALLQDARSCGAGQREMQIFTELVGVQMLLMNSLAPLLRNAGMTAEQVNAMFSRVQKSKASGTRELLARRAAKQPGPMPSGPGA
ncbi:MAG: hypothetical protein ACYCSP_16615 [Acidobacteriaceae bacterium]